MPTGKLYAWRTWLCLSQEPWGCKVFVPGTLKSPALYTSNEHSVRTGTYVVSRAPAVKRASSPTPNFFPSLLWSAVIGFLHFDALRGWVSSRGVVEVPIIFVLDSVGVPYVYMKYSQATGHILLLHIFINARNNFTPFPSSVQSWSTSKWSNVLKKPPPWNILCHCLSLSLTHTVTLEPPHATLLS